VCQDFCVNGRVLLWGWGCGGREQWSARSRTPLYRPWSDTQEVCREFELAMQRREFIGIRAVPGSCRVHRPSVTEATCFEYLVTKSPRSSVLGRAQPSETRTVTDNPRERQRIANWLLHLVRLSGYTNSKCKMTRTLYGGGGSQKCYASYCKFTSDCEEGAVR